jgi:hypothetical protein
MHINGVDDQESSAIQDSVVPRVVLQLLKTVILCKCATLLLSFVNSKKVVGRTTSPPVLKINKEAGETDFDYISLRRAYVTDFSRTWRVYEGCQHHKLHQFWVFQMKGLRSAKTYSLSFIIFSTT